MILKITDLKEAFRLLTDDHAEPEYEFIFNDREFMIIALTDGRFTFQEMSAHSEEVYFDSFEDMAKSEAFEGFILERDWPNVEWATFHWPWELDEAEDAEDVRTFLELRNEEKWYEYLDNGHKRTDE